jgi:outer membrane lipoprotein-sorting protein
MRRALILSALALCTFLCCSEASAQTADEIVQKHIAARGGADKMKAITSLKMSGKIALPGGLEAPATIQVKRPAMVRLDMTFQGQSLVQGYDGSTAWMINPFGGAGTPERVDGEEAKSIVETADIDGILFDYKAKGHAVELVGKEDVEGTPAFKLKVTKKDGDVQYHYLDASNYLTIKESSTQSMQGTKVQADNYPSNYKPVNGVLVPFAIETKVNGQSFTNIVIDKIEANVALDDAAFKMPAK